MARHAESQRLLVHFHREVGTAAHIGLLHLHQLQSLHLRKQLTRFLAEAHTSKGAATVVEGHLIGELSTKVVKVNLVDQEVGQLVDVSHHPLEIQVVGCIEEEFGVMLSDVMHAGR